MKVPRSEESSSLIRSKLKSGSRCACKTGLALNSPAHCRAWSPGAATQSTRSSLPALRETPVFCTGTIPAANTSITARLAYGKRCCCHNACHTYILAQTVWYGHQWSPSEPTPPTPTIPVLSASPCGIDASIPWSSWWPSIGPKVAERALHSLILVVFRALWCSMGSLLTTPWFSDLALVSRVQSNTW